MTNITTSSVFLRWGDPNENITFFKIKWTGVITKTNTTSSRSYYITDLTAGVNYTFCVTAVIEDNKRESEPSCISKYTGMYSFIIRCYLKGCEPLAESVNNLNKSYNILTYKMRVIFYLVLS